MNQTKARFPFVIRDPLAGSMSLAPMLPLTLSTSQGQVDVLGLIDSGAAVNVLPWSMGLQLSADWDSLTVITLSGNLAQSDARVIICEGHIAGFARTRLAFAWSKSDDVPVLHGQINFLATFDILLSRAGAWFELSLP